MSRLTIFAIPLNIFGFYHHCRGENRIAFMYATSLGLFFSGVMLDFLPIPGREYVYSFIYTAILCAIPIVPYFINCSVALFIAGRYGDMSIFNIPIVDFALQVFIFMILLYVATFDYNTATVYLFLLGLVEKWNNRGLLDILDVCGSFFTALSLLVKLCVIWYVLSNIGMEHTTTLLAVYMTRFTTPIKRPFSIFETLAAIVLAIVPLIVLLGAQTVDESQHI